MRGGRSNARWYLLERYLSAWRTTWKRRHQLTSPARSRLELQFLPAHLELVESPPHPLPRWSMRVMVAMTATALLLTVFGKLDIVVEAKAKLIPGARVKVIQPVVTGVVTRILVRDGQRAAAGQALIELDTAQAAADVHKAQTARIDASLAAARARALISAQQTKRPPLVEQVVAAAAEQQRDAQRLADGLYQEYVDKLSSQIAELARREAELASTAQQVAKLRATAPLARQVANDYKALAVNDYVAKHDFLSKEQTALEQEHELTAQLSHSTELAAAITEQHAIIESTRSQFKREQLDSLDHAIQQLTQSADDETKAETRRRFLTLYSPVSGTVQQLSVHTVGGVVTTAQSLMEIVPDDAVEVEAAIENKDIGFVNVGQEVVVKIDAFPYTRYGYLKGRVESVANDASPDKKLGLTFTTRVQLVTGHMKINDKSIDLTPGMTASVEIKTGRRAVAQYFFDPLVRTIDESLHER